MSTERKAMNGGSPNAGPVYGLGMIGALVYYWKQAEDGRGRLLAVPKAMVWPAFVVHDLLGLLAASRGSSDELTPL